MKRRPLAFTDELLEGINGVFRAARRAGRVTLHEHEVYEILKRIGLSTPKYAFIQEPGEADDALLRRFGRHVVLKVVSPEIAHKGKLGGVKRVRNGDPLFVEFVLERMGEAVRSRFPVGEAPPIEGFLLVEYIPHTQALGYEVLIGVTEDPAFGPVLTLSKGGDDAEFFAAHYDPANLYIAPLAPEEARRLVRGLKIRHKFEATGETKALDRMARAASRISRLAHRLSFAADPTPEFILQSMDVNPFVLTDDGRFVAVDGYARFATADGGIGPAAPPDPRGLAGFFDPKGVAVVGVSANPEKQSLGRNIAHLMHDMGREDLYLINPKGGGIGIDGTEYPLYRSMADLPDPVDLAVYAAPARHAVDFFRELPSPPPRAVILIPGIPSEIDYAGFVREIAGASPPGLRIIGPNCMGVYHAPEGANRGVNSLFLEEERLAVRSGPGANTVLLTQSGAFSVTAIDKFQRSRLLRAVVSFGNKLDVKIPDLMEYFAGRPGVDLIALYVEGFDPAEGRGFFDLARRMETPVIAYKSGRTDAGARAAATHTAAMTGSYEVFRAACLQAGVILADDIEDHYDLVKVFALLAGKVPRGNRVAGVVNAGFESAVGADALVHLTPAVLSTLTRNRLAGMDSTGLVETGSPFLDITPMADDWMYAGFVETVLQDENVDCVFVSVVPHTNTLKTVAETCRDPDGLAAHLIRLGRSYPKPMVVSVNAGRYYADFVSVLEENGLPVYPDIRSAITSLDRFVAYFGGGEG